jgi:phosphatidylglycerol---prolipoprotein diacylglyceryl transferase
MYPNLYFLIRDIFGIQLSGLQLVNTFGFFVALAFVGSGFVLYSELKRKEQLGEFKAIEEEIIIGAPATWGELATSVVFGFLFGYKLIGAFLIENALSNPQLYILSTQGSLGAGILVAGVMTYLKWREKDKVKLAVPEKKKFLIWPHDRVGDIVLQAALWGFIGAKIFHNLENLNDFAKDPWGSIIAFSGLTFYGGLIVATIAIIIYVKKFKISVIHFADAMAPTMLFAYAAGRIGCHMSGDGDWGIVNSHPKPFAWIPDWAWAYQYPHNVVNEGERIAGCFGNYCNQLPLPVYPTTFYEIIGTFVLFLMMWSFRKKVRQPGILTGVYLVFAGVERLLIEQIRVNNKYEFLPFQPTQAELISVFLILFGIVFLIKSKTWFKLDTSIN